MKIELILSAIVAQPEENANGMRQFRKSADHPPTEFNFSA